MDIKLLSKRFDVRQLNKADVDIIYNLCCKNEIFYQYHQPFVTKESILDDMKALPPEKNFDDKYYLGFFGKNSLVAIIDLILSYPTDDVAFIGFFMTNVECQNEGIGSNIIKDACICLKNLGYSKVRLGVDKGNPQSYHFWVKNGFCVVSENNYIVMELEL